MAGIVMFVKEITVTSQGSSFTNVLLAITITATSQIVKAPKKNLMKKTENLGSLSQIWKLKSWNLSKLKNQKSQNSREKVSDKSICNKVSRLDM
jgi:hypothetical protein